MCILVGGGLALLPRPPPLPPDLLLARTFSPASFSSPAFSFTSFGLLSFLGGEELPAFLPDLALSLFPPFFLSCFLDLSLLLDLLESELESLLDSELLSLLELLLELESLLFLFDRPVSLCFLFLLLS